MRRLIAAALLAVGACSPNVEPDRAANPNAPPELTHMSSLIGDWKIDDFELQEDGSWASGAGADWSFRYTLDGYAIEDIWIQPPLETIVDDEANRTVGINIRKFDPESGKWAMAWTTKGPGTFQTFTAQSTPEAVVMVEDAPNAAGLRRRITFYNMTDDAFDWRMERSLPDGGWKEIYRIHGSRKK